MKNVLLIGGGGYIGSVLAEVLVTAGHKVRLYDRFFFGKHIFKDLERTGNLTLVQGDNRSVLPAVFDGIDAVMDLAGISNDPSCDLDPAITEDVNFNGACHMASAAKKAGVPQYIYSSSCSIYGHGDGSPLDENSPMSPVSLYARMKIASEKELLKLADENFTVTMLRNATAFGLSRRMRFDLVINIMTLNAYKNRKIYVIGGGKQWRPLVHVRDVSRAFLAVLDAPKEKVAGQAFNVGSSEQNFQVFQIAQMVRDVVPHTEVIVIPDDPDKRTYNVDFTKIQRVLDYRTVTSPYEGIVEIKQALERGIVEDVIQTHTVDFYRYLFDAQKVLNEVCLDGRIF
jgi:nucleoside-diphosphate-sugar epimerase